ncbi:hypothetical protein OG900_09820 [Streptomyces sp. NBC_00433]
MTITATALRRHLIFRPGAIVAGHGYLGTIPDDQPVLAIRLVVDARFTRQTPPGTSY